jgi:hypothetical protein
MERGSRHSSLVRLACYDNIRNHSQGKIPPRLRCANGSSDKLCLYGINLKNSYSLERERSSYDLFAMLLKTLLNKLVRTVDVATSRTIQTVSVSIDLYVESRFNPGSLFRRNRFESSKLDALWCPVSSSDRLIHGRFKVECCSAAFRSYLNCPVNYCRIF